MTGFLYATLEPVTAAFKKRVSMLPFGGNSDQRSLLAKIRFLSGLRKGWREDITSPQHNALSEGMLTRYFAGWLCPGFKPILDWVLLNCAPGLLRLNLTACAGDCACWDPTLAHREPRQCNVWPWDRARKSYFFPPVKSCVFHESLNCSVLVSWWNTVMGPEWFSLRHLQIFINGVHNTLKQNYTFSFHYLFHKTKLLRYLQRDF